MNEAQAEWDSEAPTLSSKTREIDLFQLLLDAPEQDRGAIQQFFQEVVV